MATFKLLVPTVRIEDESLFSSHTGEVELFHLKGTDGSQKMYIWADSPTTSHFNAAPTGSYLYNTAASGLVYHKQDATTWVEVGDLT